MISKTQKLTYVHCELSALFSFISFVHCCIFTSLARIPSRCVVLCGDIFVQQSCMKPLFVYIPQVCIIFPFMHCLCYFPMNSYTLASSHSIFFTSWNFNGKKKKKGSAKTFGRISISNTFHTHIHHSFTHSTLPLHSDSCNHNTV